MKKNPKMKKKELKVQKKVKMKKMPVMVVKMPMLVKKLVKTEMTEVITMIQTVSLLKMRRSRRLFMIRRR